MKIEKVNDHQIRCTLTKADLADRELKISELDMEPIIQRKNIISRYDATGCF